MKTCFFLLLLFPLLGWFYPAKIYATEPQAVVIAYFKAMKNGDVEAMKSHMAGKLYQKRKVLLEKNKKYPEFLIGFYEGAKLEVIEVRGEIVRIQIHFPNGSIKYHNLVLRQDSAGILKIVDELNFDR